MKKILLLFTCVLFIGLSTSYAQNQDGKVKEYFSNGQLKSVGMMKNGLLTGKWKFYKEDGTLSLIGKYKDGKKDGLWISYADENKLYSKTNYRDGKKDGLYIRYTDENKLYSKTNYRDGLMDGPFTQYSRKSNGQSYIERTGNMRLGKVYGEFKMYHLNGKLERKATFYDDELNGVDYHYFENGKTQSATRYINGKKEGISISYHENGVIKSSVEYKDDGEWNVLELNDINDSPLLIGTFKDGSGTQYIYVSSDKGGSDVDRVYTYKDGEIISNRKIDTDDARTINKKNLSNNPTLIAERKRERERIEKENERIYLANVDREVQQLFEKKLAEEKEKEIKPTTSSNTIVRSKGSRKELEEYYEKNPANRNNGISNKYNGSASNKADSNNSQSSNSTTRRPIRRYNNSSKNNSRNTKVGYYCYIYSWSNALENRPEGVAYVTNVFYVNMDFNASNRHSTQLEAHFGEAFLARYGKSDSRYFTYCVSSSGSKFPHTFATRDEAERSRTKTIAKFKYKDAEVRSFGVASYVD